MRLSDVKAVDVRMISIEGASIRVISRDDSVFEFKYNSEADLSEDFRRWAHGLRNETEHSNFPTAVH